MLFRFFTKKFLFSNVYLNVLLASTAFLSFIMIVRSSSYLSFGDAIVWGGQKGFYLGSIFTAFLGLIHFLCTRKMGVPTHLISPRQSHRFFLKQDYSVLFDICESALTARKAKINTKNLEKGELCAVMGASAKSMGEKISITLSKLDNEQIAVEISSRPTGAFTLIDYGRGLENVRFCYDYILKNVQN